METVSADEIKSTNRWAELVGTLYLTRAKALIKDEDGNVQCTKECVLHEDYDNAQQVANILAKNFPNNHKYQLWNIACLFNYSQAEKYPLEDRNMRGKLSCALITKFATETQKFEASMTSTHQGGVVVRFILKILT